MTSKNILVAPGAPKSFAENYLANETLLDGHRLVIRAIRPDDRPILQEGMHHLSPQSLYSRFFSYKQNLSEEELNYFTRLDFIHHVGLLACVVENGEEVPAGVGRFIVSDEPEASSSAEVALVVDEKYQGHGIGTHLLRHLTKIARAEGLKEFRARVLADNRKMLTIIENCGLPKTQEYDCGTLNIRLGLNG